MLKLCGPSLVGILPHLSALTSGRVVVHPLLFGSTAKMTKGAMETTTLQRQIQTVEQARTEALRDRDAASLDRLLAPDFVYIHASGREEDKEAYIASITQGNFHWSDFMHKEPVVRQVGERTALMYGYLHATKHQHGEKRPLIFRFVGVWVHHGTDWKLSYLQNAKLAPRI